MKAVPIINLRTLFILAKLCFAKRAKQQRSQLAGCCKQCDFSKVTILKGDFSFDFPHILCIKCKFSCFNHLKKKSQKSIPCNTAFTFTPNSSSIKLKFSELHINLSMKYPQFFIWLWHQSMSHLSKAALNFTFYYSKKWNFLLKPLLWLDASPVWSLMPTREIHH